MVVTSFVAMAQMIPLSAVVPITPFTALLAAQSTSRFQRDVGMRPQAEQPFAPSTTLIVK